MFADLQPENVMDLFSAITETVCQCLRMVARYGAFVNFTFDIERFNQRSISSVEMVLLIEQSSFPRLPGIN